MGLFTYPVLQAADIVLYDTDVVPVGEDQRQHIELTRDVAQRFNSRFGETLVFPRVEVPEVGAKIMDLQEPTKKMSTTGGTAQGTVLMLDPPEVLERKIKSAVTDSGREVRRGEGKEGIANLIEVMSVATGETADAIEGRYDGAGYGQFKSDVAETVIELLQPIRERYDGAARRSRRARAAARPRRRAGAHDHRPRARADVRADGLRAPAFLSAATSSPASSRHLPGARSPSPRPA